MESFFDPNASKYRVFFNLLHSTIGTPLVLLYNLASLAYHYYNSHETPEEDQPNYFAHAGVMALLLVGMYTKKPIFFYPYVFYMVRILLKRTYIILNNCRYPKMFHLFYRNWQTLTSKLFLIPSEESIKLSSTGKSNQRKLIFMVLPRVSITFYLFYS